MRALLDVRLEVPGQGRRVDRGLVHPRWVQAVGGERIAEGDAVLVGQVPPRVVPHAGHRRRPHERLAEAGALLVGERDDLDRDGEVRDPVSEHLDDGDAGQDTDDPVEAAGVHADADEGLDRDEGAEGEQECGGRHGL